MSKNNVPSAEDFAHAKAAIKQNDRGLSEVRELILNQFGSRGVHEVFVFFSPTANCFGVYIFYRLISQIEQSKQSGLAEEIEAAVLETLEKVGRGPKASLNVRFEFDSHENIENLYGGNYYDRLR